MLENTTNSPLYSHALTKFRDLSRLLVIPFNLPKIGGESEEDCRNFQELGNLKKKASSCIGWAISLGKKFEEGGITEINGVMLSMIHPQLKGLDPRFITGYSILLYFAKEVSAVHILRGVATKDFNRGLQSCPFCAYTPSNFNKKAAVSSFFTVLARKDTRGGGLGYKIF